MPINPEAHHHWSDARCESLHWYIVYNYLSTHAVFPIVRRDWKSWKNFCFSFWSCTTIPQSDMRWSNQVVLHLKGGDIPPLWRDTSHEPSLKWSSLSKLSTALLNPHWVNWILKFHWDSFRCSLFWGTVVRDHDPLKELTDFPSLLIYRFLLFFQCLIDCF